MVQVVREVFSERLVFKFFCIQICLHVIHVVGGRFDKILKLEFEVFSQLKHLRVEQLGVTHQASAVLLLDYGKKEVTTECGVFVQSLPQGVRFALTQGKSLANLFQTQICDPVHVG